jgi:hypothetical protein
MGWRSLGRGVGLVFCAAIAAFLIDTIALAPLVVATAKLLRGVESVAARLIVGALVIDGSKIAGLLPAAFLIARGMTLAPWNAAALLVCLTLGLHAITAMILQQGAWLWGNVTVLACRVAMAFLLTWACAAVITRRRQKPSPKPSEKSSEEPSEEPSEREDTPR